MRILSKLESIQKIKQLNLNRPLSIVFTKKTPSEFIEQFLTTCGVNSFCLRDSSSSMGEFNYDLSKKDVLQKINNYSIFTVSECMKEADKTLILQGEIEISRDFTLTASLDDRKLISNREAMRSPNYRIYNLDLKEEKDPSIRGLSFVIDYVISHELLDVIVEFTLFSIPVGINHENIVIWELRNY